jgi:lysophospholipid acyltransferase (LPLAT)-like uncharacterized protein
VKIRSRILTRWISWAIIRAIQLLFRTCRLVYLAPEPWLKLNRGPAADDPRRGVLCVWHDALMVPTVTAVEPLRRTTCCLVSQHQDGSFLAEAMNLLGYTTVRGSTQRGGAKAVKQLLDDTADKHIVITPDGPRGPRRVLKPGAIYVASQTGRPIVAGAYACRREWRLKGRWTDALLPKPFTTVYVVSGPPISIPPDISKDDLKRYVSIVQAAMDDLSDQAERLARGEIERIDFGTAQASAKQIAA